MPELPDVEVFRRYFDDKALQQRIIGIKVPSASVLKGATLQSFGRALKGSRFQNSRRHGKYLFARLDNGRWLAMHFGMTGSLDYYGKGQDPPAYTRCLFHFEKEHHLAYVNPRKLGRIMLTDAPEQLIEDRKLGPDALDVNLKMFRALAAEHGGAVKSWLMNQDIIAGIGNVYSDEILFQAGIHPKRSIGDLDAADVKRLHKAMQSVLKTAIRKDADPDRMPANFLLPQRRKGGRCPGCGGALKAIKAAGRTAWYCPRCQS